MRRQNNKSKMKVTSWTTDDEPLQFYVSESNGSIVYRNYLCACITIFRRLMVKDETRPFSIRIEMLSIWIYQ